LFFYFLRLAERSEAQEKHRFLTYWSIAQTREIVARKIEKDAGFLAANADNTFGKGRKVVSCVAGPGTTTRRTAASRTATGTRLITATTTTGFGCVSACTSH